MSEKRNISFEELKAFARDELSGASKLAVEEALRADPVLRETYNGIVSFMEHESESTDNFVADTKKRMHRVAAKHNADVKLNTGYANLASREGWVAGIAAVLILGFYLVKPAPLEPAEYDFTDAGLSVTLSVNTEKLNEAMNAYKLENYEAAKGFLQNELTKNPKNDTLNYYLGVIAKEQKNYAKALSYFDSVHSSSTFSQKATYQRALTNWYLGKTDKAKVLFEAIEAHPEHLFHDKAAQILEQWE